MPSVLWILRLGRSLEFDESGIAKGIRTLCREGVHQLEGSELKVFVEWGREMQGMRWWDASVAL